MISDKNNLPIPLYPVIVRGTSGSGPTNSNMSGQSLAEMDLSQGLIFSLCWPPGSSHYHSLGSDTRTQGPGLNV